jgi:predicted RNase H-like HicB family nuclease
VLVAEKEGGYSTIVPELPGVASCGETREEALYNVLEALRAVIELYFIDGMEIPWQNTATIEIPDGAEVKNVVVSVES